MDAARFQQIKKKVDDLKSKKDRAEGALQQVLATLKKDFNVDSIAAARDLLKETREDAERLESEYDSKLKEFMEEWGSVLDEAAGGPASK